MITMGVAEARTRLCELLALAEIGVTVGLTKHRRLVALLVKPEEHQQQPDEGNSK